MLFLVGGLPKLLGNEKTTGIFIKKYLLKTLELQEKFPTILVNF
jgi:hypothetical protein